MDKEAAHQWIEYSSDEKCGPKLCIEGQDKQICLSKKSFDTSKDSASSTKTFAAKCSTSGKTYTIVMMDKTGKHKLSIDHIVPDSMNQGMNSPHNRELAV